MSPIKQELHFRLVLSCVLAAMISSVSLLCFICLGNIGFTYPWMWFTTTLRDVVSIGYLLAFVGNALCVAAITVVLHTQLSVADKIAGKYYQLITYVLWDSVHTILISMLLAGVNSLCVLNMLAPAKYSSIFSETHFLVFNQRTHCLVSCGVFMSLLFCLTLLIFNRLTLVYSQPPTNLSDIVKEHTLARALATIGRLFYFIPLYILCPKPFCGRGHQRLSLWILFLDVRMIALLFLVGFHLQFSWGCAVSILKWQFSKPIESTSLESILKPSGESEETPLKSSNKFEQHLALEHLADLVATNPSARASVFSLSSLGGRPVLWRQVSCWCISILEQFTATILTTNNGLLQKSARVSLPYAEIKHQGHLPASLRAQIRERTKFNALHPMPPGDSSEQPAAKLLVDGDFSGALKLICSQLAQLTKRIPGCQVLGAEVPYAVSAQLFAGFQTTTDPERGLFVSGQAVIWAIEILACLTLASYTEDAYGSAQRLLGRILVLFVDGLDAVERHLRLVGLLTNEGAFGNHPVYTTAPASGPSFLQSPRFPTSSSPLSETMVQDKMAGVCTLSYYRFSSDPSLPWRMYATLSWAVTNCLNQFGEHLESIQMSQKAKEKLRLFSSTRLTGDSVNPI